jgi:hypothetical protein
MKRAIKALMLAAAWAASAVGPAAAGDKPYDILIRGGGRL